jgi:hypothetical protein
MKMNRLLIQKHNTSITSSVLVVIFLILGCSITFSPPPKGPCPIETLLIDKTSLPEKIYYETGSRSTDDAPARVGIERVGTSFASFDKGGVVHDVYRFINEVEAQQEYENVATYYFINEKDRTEWQPPEELSDLKLNADAYKVACSTILDVEPNVQVCQFVAQYGPYVTYLNVDMIALNHDDLANLVSDLDHKINLCLDEK